MQSAPISSCQSKSTTSARGCGTSPYGQAIGNSNGHEPAIHWSRLGSKSALQHATTISFGW